MQEFRGAAIIISQTKSSKPTLPSKDRIAATVVLLRGSGTDLEIYLVERAPELRFFGGYLALPGGVRGPEDGPDHPDHGDREPLRQCALRELFEETGICLDPGLAKCDASELATLRRALIEESDATLWESYRHRQTGAETMLGLCRIRTPAFASVRYDTEFYCAHIPNGQEPVIWPGELTAGRFWQPAEALDHWRRGELLIVPPVLMLLAMIDGGDLDQFRSEAAAIAADYRRGRMHQVRFSPGILMASLTSPTLPPATTTNCVIVGEKKLFLIDPATPDAAEQERFFDLCDELIAEGRELEAILLTHHHPDHVGAVAPTSARYGLEVRAHKITRERLDPALPFGKDIADGDKITLGRAPDGSHGWELEAIFTPGHDRGHLCFQENRYQALIAGDMISTVSSIIIDPPEGHLATYMQSLERLAEREIGTLYPAHGPAVPRGGRVIEQYQSHRAQREHWLLAALAEGASSLEDLLPRVYRDVTAELYPMAARSLLAGLIKLGEEERAEETPQGWRLR